VKILLSATYQQSSTFRSVAAEADPENRFALADESATT